MEGLSKKIYLELAAPTEEDSRSAQVRILNALKEKNLDAVMSLQVMRKLHPLCESADWKLTVSLAWDGENWKIADLEAGDTSSAHYGLAVDLGSTTVVMRLLNCDTGEILIETSSYNRQIAYGMDILTRIFYSKDNKEALEEIRKATVESFYDNFKEIEAATGISSTQCIQMVVSGNTTMIHFLLGMDAFCVFHAPYAVRAERPGFILGRELEIPIRGYLFCYPAKSNYLGGDIISGLIATELYKKDEICAFFDIGTNGELVLGNKEFLLCGAGAAGPALEGGVVKTGMRAASGAVDEVHIEAGKFKLHVIGEGEPLGICGSGIVDMIAELFLNRWIDILGTLQPEKSELIQKRGDSMAVEYAPGLFFYQEDISEFIKTKAAAYTMVEIMFTESGVPMEELSEFYVAGAFGKHVSKESAITIGLYPDIDRACFVNAGNASLEGAQKLLLHREILNEIDEIIEKMTYIQYGAVERFLEIMMAAQALPHTDMERYPTVKKHFEEMMTTSRR